MVAAEGPPPCKLHCEWNLSNLHGMTAALDPRQQNTFSSFPNSYFLTTKVAFPGSPFSVKPGSKTDQTNGAYLSQNLPSRVPNPWPATNLFLKGSENAFYDQFGVKATPINTSSSRQKQFLIFDCSGDETRMIVSPFPSLDRHQITIAKTSFDDYNVHGNIVEVKKISPGKIFPEEQVDENIIFGEESEMHEDTEEINALLYSDDSDEDDYGSDDEVMSTGHSPLKVRRDYDEYGEITKVADEVASSDGSNKRQKLVDGGYKQSSLVDDASSMNLIRSSNYDDDVVESSCGICKNPSQDMDSVSSAWGKKVKVQETLKLLEEIVPGSKGKDPLLIIDGAIDYLKSLRHEAETLGVS